MSWDPELLRRQRRRLALSLAAVLVLALAGFGLIVYATVSHTLLVRSDAANDLAADAMQTAIGWQPRPSVDRPLFDEEAAEMVQAHGLVVAQLHDGGGRLVYRRGHAARVLPLTAVSRRTETGRPSLRVLQRDLRGPSGERMTLIIACDWQGTEQALHEALLRLIVAVACSSGAAAGIAYGLATVMMRPIRQAFDHQQRFIADAAHELRTPVSILNAHLEVARDEPSAPPLRTSLAAAVKAGHRLTRLIEDLLMLARIDAHRPDVLPFRLDEFLDELLDDYSFLAQEAGVTLGGSPWPAATITANPEQLRRLLANLLDNAIRHTARDGRVTVACDVQSDGVGLTVTDTGSGMAAPELARVFDRFYRGKQPVSRSGGSGLGLAIAKAIALAHGGTLTGDSQVGQGAVFTLRLPGKHVGEGHPAG